MRDARHPTRPYATRWKASHKRPSNGSEILPKMLQTHSKILKNGGPPSLTLRLAGDQVPQKLHSEGDAAPEPKGLISVVAFFAILNENEPKMGDPNFQKFVKSVFSRRLETASEAKNLKKTGSRKGARFRTAFGASFEWILSSKTRFFGRCPKPFGITGAMVLAILPF